MRNCIHAPGKSSIYLDLMPVMKLGWGLSVCLVLLREGVQAREGLHLATRGLIQIHPSFSGDGISLYPAHHPAHDPNDLEHLTPKLANELYYSQEGHRRTYTEAPHIETDL